MNIGDAPELAGIADWINSQPLTLASLRGKVVLVDFWTYSCINCKRTQPYLNKWYDMYEKDGLVIIGVHAPEFAFEKITSNVREASKKAGIRYPVALDNDFTTWNAYANQYWPAKYLIDQEWRIRYKHFWEGKYDETEKAIQELLGLWKSDERVQKIAKSYDPATFLQSNMLPEKQNTLTPETYLGTMRAKNMIFETWIFQNGPQAFSAADLQLVNNWTLSGPWKVTWEYLESFGENSALILRFAAKKVFLVVSSDMKKWEIVVNVLNDKREIVSTKTISVADDELYTVFESEQFENDTIITLQPSDGLRLHAFTFWE